jgi:glutathione peroxidase
MSISPVAAVPFVLVLALAGAQAPPEAPESAPAEEWKARSMYTIETRTLEGEPLKLSRYQGKVALVVNLASKCGLTPQYEGLEALYREFKDRGLVVIGFPCNDFGGQEPGTPEEIRSFCTSRYQVTFPVMEKISLKAGKDQSVVYRALEAKTGKLPRWNFGKYLVSRDGTKAEFFDSKLAPESTGLRAAIERALAAK